MRPPSRRRQFPAKRLSRLRRSRPANLRGRFRQAKTTAEKTTLAAEIIDAALKVKDGSADQYVLLKVARGMAAGVGDAPTACGLSKTVERFDLPAAKLTAETLLTAARKASTSSQQKGLAEAVVSVVDAVARRG